MDKSKYKPYTFQELMEMQLPQASFTVADILPTGLTMLVGMPKTGKSFMAANLCVAVSRGDNFWCYPTRKGKVLYLALEDDYSLLQKRLSTVKDCHNELFFLNEAPRLDEGLIEYLQDFIKNYPDTLMDLSVNRGTGGQVPRKR